MLLYIYQYFLILDISQLKITLDDYSDEGSDGQTFWTRIGFKHITGDGEAYLLDENFVDTGIFTLNMKNLQKKIKKDFELEQEHFIILEGGSQYIMTKKGKRKIHIGKRGGKYYIMNKKKHYIK